MMDIASGISLVAGVGTIIGTAAEHRKMSNTGRTAGYLTGGAFILFGIYEYLEHKKKAKHRWREMMRHKHKHHHPPPCPPADYKVIGGKDRDYNFEFNQRYMTMAQESGQHMWPRREPIGYLTGIGLEERGIPSSGLYSYPDNIYQHARARLAPHGWA